MNIAESLDNEQFHNVVHFQPSSVKSHSHSDRVPLKNSGAFNRTTIVQEPSPTPESITPQMEPLPVKSISSAMSEPSVPLSSFVSSPPVGGSTSSSPSSSIVTSPPVGGSTSLSPSVPSLSSSTLTMSAISPEFPVLPGTGRRGLVYVAGHIKNYKLDVLVDCGANANYISHEVVRSLGIPTSKKKESVVVTFGGGGQPVTCSRYCHIRLKLADNFQPVIQFNVIQTRFEAALGKRWLARSVPKPTVDIVKHTIRVDPSVFIQGYVKPSHTPVMSAMQFKRHLKKDQAFLCIVHPAERPQNQYHLSSIPPHKPFSRSIARFSPASSLMSYLRPEPLTTRSRSSPVPLRRPSRLIHYP
ncbi:hypothetical protein BGX30_005256 [Mortierella sp. GBA39]|nr:hypothetical protein BGX30_005256 [Mortierella sp. GBA39]